MLFYFVIVQTAGRLKPRLYEHSRKREIYKLNVCKRENNGAIIPNTKPAKRRLIGIIFP